VNLEQVTAEIRPRGEWESVDFGARMIRRDAAAIYKVWFGVTLPMLGLASLFILFTPVGWLGTLLYWWFEPVADGPILRIISRRLFGEPADARAALRDTLRLAWRNKLFLLTPYRFHFARSTAMPVTQLERLSGAPRQKRSKALNLRIFNYGTGVTIVYQHLLISLGLGIVLIGYAMVPAAYQDTIGAAWFDLAFYDGGRWAQLLNLLLLYCAQSILEPWFVGAGFGLYINCRTQLEAWDIEVVFRRMLQRRAASMAAMLCCCLALGFVAMHSSTAQAQVSNAGSQLSEQMVDEAIYEQVGDAADEQEPDAAGAKTPIGNAGAFSGHWSDDEIAPAIKAIEQDEDLQSSATVERRQLIVTPDEVEDAQLDIGWWQDLLHVTGESLSILIEISLWLILAALLLLLLLTRDRWLVYFGYERHARAARQRVIIAGGEVTAESLPDDLPGEVRRLWLLGRHREALSLLYRASVFSAVTRHGVHLPRGATESDCIVAVDAVSQPQRAAFFRRIVRAWVRCAYGFAPPDDAEVLPLLSDWQEHYGPAR
jgi:hypothetical protein